LSRVYGNTENHEHNEGDEHTHSDESEEVHANSASLEGERVKDLFLIIDAYFELKTKLADDNEKEAATAAEKVIVAFKGLAEVCGQFLEKGKQVYIAGEWRTRKWEDKDGRDRYTTEVVANDMQMLGSKKSETQAPRGPDFDEDDPF